MNLLRDYLTPVIASILLGTLIAPLLRNRFRLNLVKYRAGDSHAAFFVRAIFSAVLIGGIFGLVGGWSILLARLLFHHVGSK